MSAPLYLALVHYPVHDKNGAIVATAVTNMDIHDLARTGKTYGLAAVFVVTPTKALQLLSKKILEHWETGYGAEYNETRRQAMELVRIASDLDKAVLEIERECGETPVLVATSARRGADRVSFREFRSELEASTTPHLLVLGTGWGLTEAVMQRADRILDPIRGTGEYNHLPVRGAGAIILDRLRSPDT